MEWLARVRHEVQGSPFRHIAIPLCRAFLVIPSRVLCWGLFCSVVSNTSIFHLLLLLLLLRRGVLHLHGLPISFLYAPHRIHSLLTSHDAGSHR